MSNCADNFADLRILDGLEVGVNQLALDRVANAAENAVALVAGDSRG